LSAEARRLCLQFTDQVELASAPDGELEPVRGLANKLPEHAARVASVLALVADINAAEITADQMCAGIVLAAHYAAEARRLSGISYVNTELRLAQRLLGWLLRTWTEDAVSLPDIYQRGPNSIRDNATARRAVAILEGHGWLVPIPGDTVVAGERRREAWRIVRKV